MPWNVKRILLLMVMGFVAVGLSATVISRHHSQDHVFLGVVGLVGGGAIILSVLPTNGDH